jgi:hypothetical protein
MLKVGLSNNTLDVKCKEKNKPLIFMGNMPSDTIKTKQWIESNKNAQNNLLKNKIF